MPVAARPSRKVYEKLGDEVVNQIVDWFNQVDATYRGDLEQMNDLNFARFDAKLGERLAEFEAKFDAKMERRLAEFEARFGRHFADLEVTIARESTSLEVRLSRRIYAVSTASFFAQLAALITLFKVFAPR